jgi:formylglycine-generating enzyme required for sulfatase activity
VAGVTVTLSGIADITTTTDSKGEYQFGDLNNMLSAGKYTITPSGPGYNFTPSSKNVIITNQPLFDSENFPWPVIDVDFLAASYIAVNVNGISFKLVNVLSGEFSMGSPSSEIGRETDEGPQHQVKISPFQMGETEVTQETWSAVMGNNPSWFIGNNNPVENVSWDDAQEFIKKLNLLVSGGGFRLPTEAEWEYACRAGSKTAFANGDITETDCSYDSNLDMMGWYCGNADNKTHSVAQKQPNAWGLYDMHGNVWEWCQDWKGDYSLGLVTDPTGPLSGSGRVLRGGSWLNRASYCRSAFRVSDTPSYRSSYFGFRLARTP